MTVLRRVILSQAEHLSESFVTWNVLVFQPLHRRSKKCGQKTN